MATKTNVAPDGNDGNDSEDVNGDSPMRASLVKRFDDICFSIGDCDAIEQLADDESGTSSTVCYFELQEHSKVLAAQLHSRYRPDYVLVDCKGWVVPEAVATLACMRLQIPFVPVSCYEQHRPGKLEQVVNLLQKQKSKQSNARPSVVVAVTACENDRDPILSVFQQAGVHQILYLDEKAGSLKEQLNVPDRLPDIEGPTKAVKDQEVGRSDDLYVLFTSGTSSSTPKAVVGSHHATFHRIQWFLDHVETEKTDTDGFGKCIGSNRIGRRSKLTFVDGVNELWGGLLDPSSVLVSVRPQRLQAMGVACLYNKCNQLLLLPSQLQQMLLLPKSDTLKRVIVSGEVCAPSVVRTFYAKYSFEMGCKLYNLYGQTESTGDVCFALLHPPDKDSATVVRDCVTIGKPILDTIQIHLKKVDMEHSEVDDDANMQEVHELILEGADQLANGYLTESGELRQPFSEFATGDIGFCQNDQFYIQGRKNDLVKINGIWTSPTEIESSFATAFDLSEGSLVVAIILPDSTPDQSGQQQYKSYLLCTDKSVCDQFSRMKMHDELQVPWNLIPNNVFLVEIIPKSTSGAAKLDRRACKDMVVKLLEKQHHSNGSDEITGSCDTDESIFLSLIASALSIPVESVDKAKSFVELGGNSATSITLLYLIRQTLKLDSQILANLSVLVILNASSLEHLWAMLTGCEPPLKRAKKFVASPDSYENPSLVTQSDCHQYITMIACVDATPLLVVDDYEVIFAACQGGMIVKVNANNRAILAHKYLHGWMIQANMLYLQKSKRIVVCAHNMEGKGKVLVMSSCLQTTHWKQVVDGPVKTTPVVLQNQLWVQVGSTVLAFDLLSGQKVEGIEVKLPHPCSTSPLVISNFLAYASSDWEACLMMVDIAETSVTKILEYEIGPVHKKMVLMDDDTTTAWIAGSYGIVYRVDLEKGEVLLTHQPSTSPLSSMAPIPNSNHYIVGSYDGVCRCLDSEEEVLWESPIGAVIYAKPKIIQWKAGEEEMIGVVVTTTAGDVVLLDYKDGRMLWRHRIQAEIWSDAIYLAESKTIVFGARDSCLHFVKIPL